jgi:hypothetical protein
MLGDWDAPGSHHPRRFRHSEQGLTPEPRPYSNPASLTPPSFVPPSSISLRLAAVAVAVGLVLVRHFLSRKPRALLKLRLEVLLSWAQRTGLAQTTAAVAEGGRRGDSKLRTATRERAGSLVATAARLWPVGPTEELTSQSVILLPFNYPKNAFELTVLKFRKRVGTRVVLEPLGATDPTTQNPTRNTDRVWLRRFPWQLRPLHSAQPDL